MARNKTKPFTRTEIKILIYNKIKRKGMSYDEARKEVEKEIKLCLDMHNKAMKEEKKDPNQRLKEDYEKQCKRKT